MRQELARQLEDAKRQEAAWAKKVARHPGDKHAEEQWNKWTTARWTINDTLVELEHKSLLH